MISERIVTGEVQGAHSELVGTLQHRHWFQSFYVPNVDGGISAHLDRRGRKK